MLKYAKISRICIKIFLNLKKLLDYYSKCINFAKEINTNSIKGVCHSLNFESTPLQGLNFLPIT